MASFTLNAVAASLPACTPPANKSSFTGFNGLRSFRLVMPMKAMTRPTISKATSRQLSIFCQSTLEEVQDIIASQLSVDRASVQPQTKFSDLGADSLDTVEIVMSLEEKFGVSIGEQDAENISTVQQVADLIEKQKV